MLRIHDLDLTDEDGETRHKDDIDAALADLCMHAAPPDLPDPRWEATIHLRIWFDPEERLKERRMQAAQMGRYLHQPVLQWLTVDVAEFEDYYRCLTEILGNEAPLDSAGENQM